MNEDSSDKPWQKGRSYAAIALVILPLLYLIAYGPLCAIYDDCPHAVQIVLELIYSPLQVTVEVAGAGNLFVRLMERYVELCTSWRESEEPMSSSVYY